MSIKENFKRWVHKMTNSSSINIYEYENKILPKAEIEKYKKLYENRAPWITYNVRSLNLCKSITQEVTKSTLAEYSLKCENTDIQKICDAISKHNVNFLTNLCVYGNVLIRPYISGDKSGFTIFGADSFDVDFDSYGNLSEVIIYNKNKKKSSMTNEDIYYTLVERHTFYEKYINNNSAHVIRYKLFESSADDVLGIEVSMSDVKDYANISEEIIIEGVDRNLCVLATLGNTEYFIGTSYFENAYNLIEDADKLYSSVLWEYEGGELAINADKELFRQDKSLNDKTIYTLPKGKERLYRMVTNANITGDNTLAMTTFAPQLRDSSYWQGLNNVKRNIELTEGLSYGIISEPTNVAMTATEIVSSKQRFYTTIRNFQKILMNAYRNAVENLILMENSLDKNIPEDYDLVFHFDDSILTTAKEKVDELAVLLGNQIITKEEAREKYLEN